MDIVDVQQGADIRSFIRSNDTKQVLETVRYNPAIIHKEDDLGWTILHEAIRFGQTEMVEILLAHGADKDHYTKNGESPLVLARYFLNDEEHMIIRLLKSLGATSSRRPAPSEEL
jgi:ankyrin repeat protein